MTALSGNIGPYTIDREIGRGGMGVVYRATDSRLGRDVAIKALPEHLAADPDRLARFEREARTLASLSHPNVAGIHGLEEHEGHKYLVLEFVEGETLADRIDRGPLPIDDALEIGAQIAAGLEAAHEAGVIHRDLKPANIKITPEGEAKILDFGLARSDDQRTSSTGSVSQAPTITTPDVRHSPTIPGAILGTAPYMSPEQARGRKVDRRSDIWSLGVVLYESLTGASPFVGETTTDTIGAILHKDVDLGLLPQQTPARVRDLLTRMIVKDKAQRQRDAGDVLIELQRARGEGGDAHSAAVGARGLSVGFVAVTLTALAAAFVSGVVIDRAIRKPTEPPSSIATNFAKLTDSGAIEAYPAISPDGQTVIYQGYSDAGADLFSVRVGGSNATNLTPNTPGLDEHAAFSPDGTQIAFRSDRGGGGIWVMGATGESPRRLTDFGNNPSWSPDGSEIVFATERIVHPMQRSTISQLWVVDVASGATRKIHDGDAVQPSWSPNGARIVYWGLADGGQRNLYTVRPDGAGVVALSSGPPTEWQPTWSGDGDDIFFLSNRNGSFSIWRVAVDEESGEALAPPTPVTAGEPGLTMCLAVSRGTNRIAYAVGESRLNVQRVAVDLDGASAEGAPEWITRGTSSVVFPRVAPDGASMAATVNRGVDENLVVFNLKSGARSQLTFDAHRNRTPVWTPGGDRILFSSDRSGKYELWDIRLDGSAPRRRTDATSGAVSIPVFSPDGAALVASTTVDGSVMYSWSDDDALLTPQPISVELGQGEVFSPRDWMGEDSTIVGVVRSRAGAVGVAVINLESGEVLWRSDAHQEVVAIDSARVLAATSQAVELVDITTGEISRVLDAGSDFIQSIDYSEATGHLYCSRIEGQYDIWVAELPE